MSSSRRCPPWESIAAWYSFGFDNLWDIVYNNLLGTIPDGFNGFTPFGLGIRSGKPVLL